jgi:DNA polymerase elongation subunit (family B)
VNAHLASEVTRINGQLDTLISQLETAAKTAIAKAGQDVEDSATANFERVINLTQTNTPIKVDAQKLKWVAEKRTDGSVKFTVTNENKFDVVFRYAFLSNDGIEQGGVSETKYAESNAKPGVTVLEFDTETLKKWGIKFIDVGGVLVVQYLDENGKFQHGAEIGFY